MSTPLRQSEISPAPFDYRAAFSRNIGWVTEWEQQELRKKTVAIAGLGGVGGAHALTLSRLGIGGFHVADLDRFDVVNFNRQSGAFMSSLGGEKTTVMSQMMRDINPGLRLKIFDRGVSDANLDEFLAGADLFVDGLDFFVIDIRRKVFRRCAELGIPAITAGPIGFGSSYLIFVPGGMTFEEYFRFEGLSDEQQHVNFALGLTPKGFHRKYLADPSRLDLANHRGPSTAAAIQLCAGIVAAEGVKLLLGRGKVHAAPAYHQFDAYSGRWKRGKLRFGNGGPLQSLKRKAGYRIFSRLSQNAWPGDAEAAAAGSDIEKILDLARWAPSGDNAQPWRFEIRGENRIIVRLRIEGEEKNIYDYANGQPSLLSGGMLLESIRIAASRFGREAHWTCLREPHAVEVVVPKSGIVREDPLCSYLTIRSVDRRPYTRRPLTSAQKSELEAALGDELRIEWREPFAARWKLASICAAATDIRLRSHEAYEIHRRILDWDRRFSPAGIPAAAVGVDPVTRRMMRALMRDWRRVDLANRYFGGTVIPRIQLDLIPGIFSAAYFTVSRSGEALPAEPTPDLLRAGERLQRFWLTTTRMGLALQPALAPLCFAWHGRNGGRLSALPKAANLAQRCAGMFAAGSPVIFLGRIGTPRNTAPAARSLRQTVAELLD